MDIYLDTCALNRLTDDPSQPRVKSEADAVETILHLVTDRRLRWVTSAAVRLELSRNPDPVKRAESLPLLHFASIELSFSPEVKGLATLLNQTASASSTLYILRSARPNVLTT